MDHGHFDDLTRSVADGGGTRRALLRLLAGGAAGSFAARLGLADITEVKATKHKPQKKQELTSRSERKAHGQLQAEGKRPMSTREFLAGHRLQPGRRFTSTP